MLSVWLTSLLSSLLQTPKIKTKKPIINSTANVEYFSILSQYLSYKIHLTSHSTYDGEIQESFLLSPKHLRGGDLGFSGSDHFLPLNWFSFLEYLYLSLLALICYPFPRFHLGLLSIKGPIWHKMQCVWDLYKSWVYVQNWTSTYSRECYIFVFFA